MKLGKIVELMRLGGKALGVKDRISKADICILKVAFLVAAIDGEVTAEEFTVFDAMARRCKGYDEEQGGNVLDDAMRSAGYLLLVSSRLSDTALVKAFIDEVDRVLPAGYAYFQTVAELRRAFITWIAMGMSDGDYSIREKKCIDALRKHFAAARIAAMEGSIVSSPMPMFSKDDVENIARRISGLDDTAAAARKLKELL